MSEERAFLAAIGARPDDRTARLVYADWLEERGDRRGELIRVEDEIRTVPIHSDRYWELKPRRPALLKQAKKPWLKRMGYGGTDYEAVFADVPADWKGRWRLLREFTERWHGVPMGDVGGPVKATRRKEERIDPALLAKVPPSLREWAAFIRDLAQSDERHGASNFGPGGNDGHQWADLGERVTFLNFNGGRFHCTVAKSELANPDPPVEYGFIHGPFECSFPRVTTFAFQYLMSTWNDRRAALKAAVRVRRTKALAKQLAAAFPVRSEWDGIEIYEKTNVVAFLNQDRYFTNGELNLHVMAREPATESDIPAFVLKYRPGRSAGFEG
jgi:uncharacterized protein (TIGR02996 family)